MTSLLLAAALLLSQDAQPKPAQGPAKPAATVDSLIGGVVRAEDTWAPLTGRARWNLFWRENFMTPGVFIRPAFPALFDHIDHDPKGWGLGAKGYATRYGSQFGVFTLQGAMETSLAAAAGYDTRYIRCKCTGGMARTGHAILWNFLTYNHEGKKRLALTRFAANFAAPVVADRWRPAGEHDPWRAVRSGTTFFYYGSVFNVLAEFLPEIRRAAHMK